jgi:hypothetical protein
MAFTANHARITDLSISFPGSLSPSETETITSSLLDRKIHEITDWGDALFWPLMKEEPNPETFLERQLLPFQVSEVVNELFLVPQHTSSTIEEGD